MIKFNAVFHIRITSKMAKQFKQLWYRSTGDKDETETQFYRDIIQWCIDNGVDPYKPLPNTPIGDRVTKLDW